MTRGDPQINIRINIALKTRVHEHAKKNRRSVNSEINFLLETALNELASVAGTTEAGKTTNTMCMETCDAKYNP